MHNYNAVLKSWWLLSRLHINNRGGGGYQNLGVLKNISTYFYAENLLFYGVIMIVGGAIAPSSTHVLCPRQCVCVWQSITSTTTQNNETNLWYILLMFIFEMM